MAARRKTQKRRPATGRIAAKKPAARAGAGTAAKRRIPRASQGRTAPRNMPDAALLKKVASVSENTKALAAELKSMTRIFSENQKVLVSLKSVIDTVSTTTEHLQKQSRRLTALEGEAQKLLHGLDQVKSRTDLVSKLSSQTSRLEEKVARIQKDGEAGKAGAARGNSQAMTKIAEQVEKIRGELQDAAGRAKQVASMERELNDIREILKLHVANSDTKMVEGIRADLSSLSDRMSKTPGIESRILSIEKKMDAVAAGAESADSLAGTVAGLREQLGAISQKAGLAPDLSSAMDATRSEISGAISKNVAEMKSGIEQGLESARSEIDAGLGAMRSEMDGFRQKIIDKTDSIGARIDSLAGAVKGGGPDAGTSGELGARIESIAETVRRTQESFSELYARTEEIFKEFQQLRSESGRTAETASGEAGALLHLLEYQSGLRMTSESKYGGAAEIEGMALKTVQVINLFDGLSVESQEKMNVPHDIRRWAVSKMLDCADRWEIRFSDVYGILKNAMGKELLAESVRLEQVRDIFGVRAVDEIKQDLGIE